MQGTPGGQGLQVGVSSPPEFRVHPRPSAPVPGGVWLCRSFFFRRPTQTPPPLSTQLQARVLEAGGLPGHAHGAFTAPSPCAWQRVCGGFARSGARALHLPYHTAGPTCPVTEGSERSRAHSQSAGQPGRTLTATGGVSPSTARLSKSPRQPGRQWSLTKPRPQRPGVPGSSELLPAPPQPRGPLLHPGLPWTLCAVVTSREIDPEIGKQDAMSRYRAGGDKGWPGDGEGRGQEQGPR